MPPVRTTRRHALFLLPAAVAAGRFQVFPIATVDQALELLCGAPAGERDARGAFPEGSLNRRVEARLLHYSRQARRAYLPQSADGADPPELGGFDTSDGAARS